MLGMGAIATKSTEIKPFQIYVGNPAHWLKQNDHGLKAANVDEASMRSLQQQYDALKAQLPR